ncbi:MAG: GGDEF domain-containing protein [Treponema sp.]|nr:GGDEF domain-containing protein [Treponema sp.]
MPLVYSFNTLFGSFLVIVIICIDYLFKYNTDAVQRKIFVSCLIMTLPAIVCDFAHQAVVGQSGQTVQIALYIINTVYYISQVGAMYLMAVFLDYISFKDMKRLKIIIMTVAAINLLHIIALLLNLQWGFYFFFTSHNEFMYGDKYFIRLLISYLPFIIDIVDLLISYKNVSVHHINLVFIILILSSAGNTLSFIANNASLFWICSTACLLTLYLFIIRAEAKFDVLTGVGNRGMFYEFIDRLNKQSGEQSWSIALLDIDDFKSINSVYGHIEGDNVLRNVAVSIKGCIRASDLVVRYGNDEFILAVQSEYDIDRLIARIQQAIYDQNEKSDRAYKLRLSYGYDSFVTHSEQNINDVLIHIEKLMCSQKNAKRRSGDRSAE